MNFVSFPGGVFEGDEGKVREYVKLNKSDAVYRRVKGDVDKKSVCFKKLPSIDENKHDQYNII